MKRVILLLFIVNKITSIRFYILSNVSPFKCNRKSLLNLIVTEKKITEIYLLFRFLLRCLSKINLFVIINI